MNTPMRTKAANTASIVETLGNASRAPMARGALIGASTGAITGAGAAGEDHRMEGALKGGLGGAVVGGVAGAAPVLPKTLSALGGGAMGYREGHNVWDRDVYNRDSSAQQQVASQLLNGVGAVKHNILATRPSGLFGEKVLGYGSNNTDLGALLEDSRARYGPDATYTLAKQSHYLAKIAAYASGVAKAASLLGLSKAGFAPPPAPPVATVPAFDTPSGAPPKMHNLDLGGAPQH